LAVAGGRRIERPRRRVPMEINGVAHIFVTAGDFEKAKAFYMKRR